MNKHQPRRPPLITDAELAAAIEEADKTGAFVSADKVHDWMRSWGKDEELPQPTSDVVTKKA